MAVAQYGYLVKVHVHALELEVRGTIVAVLLSVTALVGGFRASLYVHTRAIKAVLARDGLPEGGTNLVTL